MPIKKIKRTVRTIDAALRDAHRARHAHSDPGFDRELQKDRRTTLRRFDTVEHALQDRERLEKTGEKAGPGATKATKATKAKAKKR